MLNMRRAQLAGGWRHRAMNATKVSPAHSNSPLPFHADQCMCEVMHVFSLPIERWHEWVCLA